MTDLIKPIFWNRRTRNDICHEAEGHSTGSQPGWTFLCTDHSVFSPSQVDYRCLVCMRHRVGAPACPLPSWSICLSCTRKAPCLCLSDVPRSRRPPGLTARERMCRSQMLRNRRRHRPRRHPQVRCLRRYSSPQPHLRWSPRPAPASSWGGSMLAVSLPFCSSLQPELLCRSSSSFCKCLMPFSFCGAVK